MASKSPSTPTVVPWTPDASSAGGSSPLPREIRDIATDLYGAPSALTPAAIDELRRRAHDAADAFGSAHRERRGRAERVLEAVPGGARVERAAFKAAVAELGRGRYVHPEVPPPPPPPRRAASARGGRPG